MGQKRCVLVLSVFLLSLLLIGIISAQTGAESGAAPSNIQGNIKTVIDNIVEIFQPIAEAVLGQEYDSTGANSTYFFARILFFIVILTILYLVLERVSFFNEYTFALWIVAAAVAILGTRYFVSNDWIKTILLPYQTLGIVIAAGLPFVIYFLIVNTPAGMGNQPPIIRKIAWIFFAVIFFGLWISRSGADDLGESSAIWIYPITAALAFVMVVMDGTVTRFFAKVDVEKSTLDSKKYQLRYLKRELQKLHEDLAKRVISRDEYLAETHKINQRITLLTK